MSIKKPYQRPFQNSFSRPAHYQYVGKDKADNIVIHSAVSHDFYPKACIQALDQLGVPRPGR